MKQLIAAIALLLLISKTTTLCAQEEFFGNRNGLSLSYSNGIKQDEKSVGASLYIKNKMLIGINTVTVYNRTYPFFSVLACPHWAENTGIPKFGYGLTYGYVEENHIIGLNLILTQPLLTESKFPLSIQGSIIVSAVLNNFNNRQFDLYPAVGLGYTQAFFAGNQVYPLIGLSYSYDLNGKADQFSAHLGINVKIGKVDSDKKK